MTQDCPPTWAILSQYAKYTNENWHTFLAHGICSSYSYRHCIVMIMIIVNDDSSSWFEFCKEIMCAGNLDGLRGHHWLLPSHGEPNLYSTKKVLLTKYHPEIPIHPTFIARFTWWWSGCWSLPFSSPSPSTDSSLLATPTGEIARQGC